MNFLCAADEVEHFFRLLRQAFEFSGETGQGLIETDELVSIFFQEFAAGFEGEASVAGRKQGEEKLRAVAQAAQCAGERG